jgi:hypothetical protein
MAEKRGEPQETHERMRRLEAEYNEKAHIREREEESIDYSAPQRSESIG